MKNKKELKKIAQKILKCERKIRKGLNVEENQAQVTELALGLDFEEMLWIDDYIMKQNFLTK